MFSSQLCSAVLSPLITSCFFWCKGVENRRNSLFESSAIGQMMDIIKEEKIEQKTPI